MKFAIDTSAYSDFNRGDSRLRKWFVSANTMTIPLVVIGELRAGFAAGSKKTENEVLLRRFLDMPSVSTATITDKTTEIFAELYLSLRKAGKTIGTNDLWIASVCLEHNIPLLTLDADFSNVCGLELIII